MTLSWRTEYGKQPAIMLGGSSSDKIEALIEAFRHGHKVVDILGQQNSLQLRSIVNLENEAHHSFILDFAGDDTMLVLAHWSDRSMADRSAFQTVTDRMYKLVLEIREARELERSIGGPLIEIPIQKEWMEQIVPDSIPEDDLPITKQQIEEICNQVAPDFSPAGPHETPGFRGELRQLLNKYSKDTETGMPDFILAQLIAGQLESLAEALKTSDDWKKS